MYIIFANSEGKESNVIMEDATDNIDVRAFQTRKGAIRWTKDWFNNGEADDEDQYAFIFYNTGQLGAVMLRNGTLRDLDYDDPIVKEFPDILFGDGPSHWPYDIGKM